MRILLALAFAACLPSVAFAVCPSPLTGKDAAGTTQNFGITVDAGGNCYGNAAIVDGSNAANKATVAASAADATTNSTPGLWAYTFGFLFNGTTWDRWKGDATNGAFVQVKTLPALPTGGNTIGAVTQASGPWTSNVTQFGGTNISTGTGASGAGIPRVTVSNDSSILATLQASASTAIGKVDPNTIASWGLMSGTVPGSAPSNTLIAGGIFNTVAPTPTNGQTLPLQLDGSGNLDVNIKVQAALPAGGNTIGAVNQGTSPWVDNITQFGGTNLSTGTGAGGAGIPRVTVSNDSNVLATQSGNWTTRIVGNAGGVLDAAGQNATSAANSVLVGAQFNTTPTTVASGNMSPLQMDSAGNLLVNIKAGGGSGGTSSNFGSAFPAAGTAAGMSQGGNMVALTGTSGNLNVQCANCSGSGASATDEASFTAGASTFAPTGGFFQTNPALNPLTTGQQGMQQFTAGRAAFVNLRNSSNVEIGTAANPLQVGGPQNVAQFAGWPVAIGLGPSNPGTQRVSLSTDSIVGQAGTWNINNVTGSISLPAGAATAANQTNASQKTQIVDSFGSVISSTTNSLNVNVTNANPNGNTTDAGSSPVTISSQQTITGQNVASPSRFLDPCQYNLAPTAITSGNASPLQCDVGGRLLVNVGTVSTGPQNVTQINGWPISTGIGPSGPGVVRVALSTDSAYAGAIMAPGQVATAAQPAQVVVQSPSPSLQCPYVAAVNQTANTQVITNAGGKSIHLCTILLLVATAQNVSVVEGTGSTCGTGTAGMVGGTSASVSLATNGGWSIPSDRITIPMQKPGDNVCVLQSASNNTSGVITYGLY